MIAQEVSGCEMALGLLASFTRSQGQRVSQIADALLAAFFASNARVGRQPAKLLKSRNFLRTHSLSIKPCGETLFFLFLYFSLDLKASLCFVLFSFVPPSKLGRFCSFFAFSFALCGCCSCICDLFAMLCHITHLARFIVCFGVCHRLLPRQTVVGR